ncbi:hypothetical protein [Algibacter sp. R77976]|uniref:hypothetical protein n=1 Tax=Algibacter sp. R77976 TaxID=3093873 RepID=UPI0037C933A1
MKKLFFKLIIYLIGIFIVIELLIRVLHLTKDHPIRVIDEYGVEKWQPIQEGYSVTGNRRQNFSKFRINNSGYNSYREFHPSSTKFEIALVGDSFIEGFHQDFDNSIGKKIENKLENIVVYEYGYAGYDLADQLHLIHKYKEEFDLIDYVFIGLEVETDLERKKYEIIKSRIKLESPLYKNLRKIKLLTYLKSIGVVDVGKKFVSNLISFKRNKKEKLKFSKTNIVDKYIENFDQLVSTYGFNKKRFIFFLETDKTPLVFINHLNENNYKYLDLSKCFKSSDLHKTLIYDKHWNNHGRDLVSNQIASMIELLKKN